MSQKWSRGSTGSLIKIDKTTTQHLDSPYHRAAICALAAWAGEVGATICAEGIETPRQRDALARLGVHLGQGYLLGRATVPDDATETRTPEQTATTHADQS